MLRDKQQNYGDRAAKMELAGKESDRPSPIAQSVQRLINFSQY